MTVQNDMVNTKIRKLVILMTFNQKIVQGVPEK